jgi:hypothetical protein
MRWAAHLAGMGEMLNAYTISVGNTYGELRNSIDRGFSEIRCEGVKWIRGLH